MSKITLAFGSFIVGLAVGSVFLGSHTVALAQSPSTPSVGIRLHMEPTIPGLGPELKQGHIIGYRQPLDGLNCEDCEFTNAVIQYSGGAVRLVRPVFGGTIRVELTGAAANTAALMPLLTAIASGNKPEPINPNRPIVKTASAKAALKLDAWQTPYQK
jgi:hypothetical protein